MDMSTQVKLVRHRETYIATQWLQDGDHQNVSLYKGKPAALKTYCNCGFEDMPHGMFGHSESRLICPGTWILESTETHRLMVYSEYGYDMLFEEVPE